VSLYTLLNPFSQEKFFQDIWEAQVLHIKRNDPSYFGFLLDNLLPEEIIWQTCHTWGEVSLARAQTDYEKTLYASQSPSVPLIGRAFADDYTVVINNLDRKNVIVAQFCREIERVCFFNTNANLYLTRANTQGLDHHYDDQDVFILQIQGEKIWRIYETRAELPLDDVPYERLECDASTYQEYLLQAGDVLYIPRGFIHEARALCTTSMHLTLSVSVVRWATYLQRLIHTLARSDVELRKAVPLQVLKSGRVNALGQTGGAALARRIASETQLGAVISEIQDQVLSSKTRLPLSQTFSRYGCKLIGMGTCVGVADDQVHVLYETEQAFLLKFIGTSIELSRDLVEPIAFLCRQKTFMVHELPGNLADTEKIALVSRLLECGFLVRLDEIP
jgi:ribosomal protein L16 Arg81 hydroxylase